MAEIPKTPWPIELNEHPFEERYRQGKESNKENQYRVPTTEEVEKMSKIEVAKECFSHPESYRNLILEHVAIKPKEAYDGGSVYYMWLNKVCPVGCEFCFFQSPAKCEGNPEDEITDEGIEKIIQITKDGQMDKFVVSGGGEPIKAKNKVNNLARGVKTKNFVVVTSAYWSRGKNATDKILSGLLENSSENPYQPTTTIRVSLDECHFEKLSKDKGFQYVNNVIDWFADKASDNPKFKLAFHTMEGDKTVEELLAQLPVESREETNPGEASQEANHRIKIKLKNNLSFDIEHTQTFLASPYVNLKDQEEQARNQETFKKFIFSKRQGNMSVSHHGDKPNGVYYLTFYNGQTIIWGSTAPDTETSIYNDDYRTIMDKNLKDVATLGILEKGQYHMQEIVSEISPKTVERTIGVGLRDFYVRLLLEEDTTRLYASVRLMQEYMAEGRISEEEQAAWPAQLKVMVSLPQAELKEACLESPKTIIQQYLDDRTVSVDKLTALHTRIALGHYSVKPEDMYRAVREANIAPEIKQGFLAANYPPQSNLDSF